MSNDIADGMVGFTDEGYPLVLSEYSCARWLPGACPTLNIHTCWYCRYADFRKTSNVVLAQSICRCPKNRLHIIRDNANEHLEAGL